MKGKPAIAVVGAGNVANALAVSLRLAGYRIEVVSGRSAAESRARTRKLAKEVGAIGLTDLPGNLRAQIVWFCVPDREIRRAAERSAERIDWAGRIALHPSGALASDELNVLRERGAAVASAHPLMTFVRGSRPTLAAVPFAIEGDPRAVRIARELVKNLNGRAYSIRKQEKAAYHAWGTFISPLLTSLLATAEQVARAAGVPQKEARARMLPILRQTLENYAGLGAAAGFSGPIVRGDVETVRRHWRALRSVPAAQEAYRALLLSAVRYLPAKNREQLRRAVRG
jgi:predicted short-subunit dehydrogenase-like oxidoreductase (DUF2520 family)